MQINKTISIIAGAMLLLAIPSMWPYGYYQILRWTVSLVGISNAYKAYELNLKGWVVAMAFVAILFNPIAPITFEKEIWVVFDVAVAIIMFVYSLKFDKK